MMASERPYYRRGSSRLPGGFEDNSDDDDNQIPNSETTTDTRGQTPDETSILPPDGNDSSSLFLGQSDPKNTSGQQENTFLEEQEMKRKLMAEEESSFIPELSYMASSKQESVGADDTYLFGVPKGELSNRPKPSPIHVNEPSNVDSSMLLPTRENGFSSPQTPPGAYKTPAPEQQEERLIRAQDYDDQTPQPQNTSSLETMSSSPTAAAAARTVSRVISIATNGENDTEDGRADTSSPTQSVYHNVSEDQDDTPRNDERNLRPEDSSSPSRLQSADDPMSPLASRSQKVPGSPDKRSIRPNYLRTRSSSNRLSRTSISSSNTDTASNVTIGADYALQTGGAVPTRPSLRNQISRMTSLGSMASGVSGLSDDDVSSYKRTNATSDLSPLHEERPSSRLKSDNELLTPKASIGDLAMPSDTVIAKNVKDLEVPGTFARQYRKDHRSVSPTKSLAGMTPGPNRSGVPITLKGQREHVEKLSKENFDLKMKIHFLDEALQRRSEDGMNDLLTENAQLKFDRVQLQKDNFNLRKSVRDLERKMDEMNEAVANAEKEKADISDARSQAIEEEVLYLKETIETQEIEIEKLRTENMAKESEKRKMAEAVKSMGDSRPGTSEAGSRERLDDMWRDLLEGAESARVIAEQESKRLREENTRLRQESQLHPRLKHSRPSSAISSQRDHDAAESNGSTDGTLNELERLRSQILELQKVISVQADQLTRRARKEDRLYQQIEDLRVAQRTNGSRSVAGDSIFERSASRVGTNSRAGIDSPEVGLGDVEREELEAQIDGLRDQISSIKLEKNQFNGLIDQMDAEIELMTKEAHRQQKRFDEDYRDQALERENLVAEIEEQEQKFRDLQADYVAELDSLESEMNAKADECERLQNELKLQGDNFFHLQSEMRSATGAIDRLEHDSQQNLQRANAKERELDYATRDIEDLERQREAVEKSLEEANSQVNTLTVRQETLHQKLTIQNEEQENDRMSIAELKAELESEKDRAHDFNRRLAEERQQREAVAGKEKKEISRIMNDLNRQATSAAEEARQLKKSLVSCEIEATTFKEQLAELENNLRSTLGDPSGSRASFVTSITTIQKGLQITLQDLDETRQRLDEKETALASRDSSLESLGLEYRRVVETVERERQNRKADKISFEEALKTQQGSTRAIAQHKSRITELENARRSERSRQSQVEQQWREQLNERNNVLLSVWKKLSAMCGPDWTHSNSLVNGNLPSLEVIGNMLFWPVFSRNLMLAATKVEGSLSTCRDKIKRLEQTLRKEYSTLEANLDMRLKRLDRVEDTVSAIRQAQQHAPPTSRSGSSNSTEVAKLRAENRNLRSEVHFLQHQYNHPSHIASHARNQADGANSTGTSPTTTVVPPRGSSSRGRGAAAHSTAIMTNMLTRHHSTNVIEHLNGGTANWDSQSLPPEVSRGGGGRSNSIVSSSQHPSSIPLPSSASTTGSTTRDRDINNLMLPSSADLPGQIMQMQQQHASSNNINDQQQQQQLAAAAAAAAGGIGEQKWIHRLRELERRLKAEREARLLDRSGARKRLEERDRENEGLRRELEREKERKEAAATAAAAAAATTSGSGSGSVVSGDAGPVNGRGGGGV